MDSGGAPGVEPAARTSGATPRASARARRQSRRRAREPARDAAHRDTTADLKPRVPATLDAATAHRISEYVTVLPLNEPDGRTLRGFDPPSYDYAYFEAIGTKEAVATAFHLHPDLPPRPVDLEPHHHAPRSGLGRTFANAPLQGSEDDPHS